MKIWGCQLEMYDETHNFSKLFSEAMRAKWCGDSGIGTVRGQGGRAGLASEAIFIWNDGGLLAAGMCQVSIHVGNM